MPTKLERFQKHVQEHPKTYAARAAAAIAVTAPFWYKYLPTRFKNSLSACWSKVTGFFGCRKLTLDEAIQRIADLEKELQQEKDKLAELKKPSAGDPNPSKIETKKV